ncbi:MAG: accessory gene regulator B family protein [Candidatus Anstonellales archaeon]
MEKYFREIGKSDEEIEVIRYGLKVLVHSISKTILMLAIAYVLGIVDLFLVSYISFAIYRSFAGGVHARGYMSCLIVHALILFSSIYIATDVIHLGIEYYYIAIVFSLYVLVKYIPRDTEFRPFMSEFEVKRNRVISYMLYIITICLYINFQDVLVKICVLSMFSTSLLVHPITYKVFKIQDGSNY